MRKTFKLNKIVIKPAPTGDSRTCDVSEVSLEELHAASEQHIRDVNKVITEICGYFQWVIGRDHDFDKLTDLAAFYADFQTGFASHEWLDQHKRTSRHHLDYVDGVPSDVNLLDVLEHIIDCVVAGMARSGSVWPLELSNTVLQTAFDNTVALLEESVIVETDRQDEQKKS